MRQNLFSLWASSRLMMATTESRSLGPWRAPHAGDGGTLLQVPAPLGPPYEGPGSRSWVSGVGVGGRQVLPRSCPDHVSDFHRKEEQLGYIVIYRGVESWPRHLGGPRPPKLLQEGEGAQCWCFRGIAVLATGRSRPAPPLGPAGGPQHPAPWGSLGPASSPWGAAFLPWVPLMCFEDHFCIVRSEEKIF